MDDDTPSGQLPRFSRRQVLGAGALAGGSLFLPAHARGAALREVQTAATLASPKRGGVLNLGTPQPIQTLDPHAFGIYNNRNAWPGLYSGLTRYDPALNPLPDLARAWEHSADGLTWTFHLRTNVKFHNGDPLTSADVKYSIERVLDPKTVAGVYAQGIKEIAKVDAVDGQTVRLHLSQPSAILLASLARVMIIPNGSGTAIATKAIGTGPFQLKSYVVNDHLTMARYEDYWDKAHVHLDGVNVRTVPDPTALLTAFLSGDVDVYWQLDPKYLSQISNHSGVKALRAKTSSVVKYMVVDDQSPPFNQLEVRQALLHAMDLKTINDLVFYGTGTLTDSDDFLPPGHWAQSSSVTKYPYDLKKAKALFAKHKVTELSYVGLNIVPWTNGVGAVLQQSLASIGVNLKTSSPELSVWSAAYNPHPAPGVIVPNAALPDYDPAFIWAIADPANKPPWRFTNGAFAKLLSSGRRTLSEAGRKSIYGSVQKIWSANVPTPVICHDAWIHGVSKRVNALYELNSGDLDYRSTWLA